MIGISWLLLLLLLSPLRNGWLRCWRLRREGLLLLLACLLDDGREHRGVHQTHEHKRLENGEAELRGLVEELGRPFGVGHGELLHLREDVEELTRWEGGEGGGDGVGKGHAGLEVDALGQCGKGGCNGWWLLAWLGLWIEAVGRIVRYWDVVGRDGIVFAPGFGVVDLELAAHDGVFVQIPYGGGGGIGIREFDKPKAFGAPGFVVVDKTEVDYSPNGTEELYDRLF